VVFKLLRSLLSKDSPELPAVATEVPAVLKAGDDRLALEPHVKLDEGGFSRLDWETVRQWVEGLDEPLQAAAWAQAEIAWLLRLRSDLGAEYRLDIQDGAALVSSLDPNVARSTLDFMTKSLRRITAVLDGVASSSEWGHDILLVFEDDETYYRYVSYFYGQDGEFAASGGMFINDGCSHFVTMKSDLRVVEPVIVHEMTHACLSHLPIPAWLNEGLAVNTERRLSPPLGPEPLTPRQMHEKHREFWTAENIQEFWSGKSWLRTDDGNMLSYDLARILVSEFATDWERFKQFALNAHIADAGHSSAVEHLEVDLGAAVCAVLELESDQAWRPTPAAWPEPPERGAFRGDA
jgi:hypothetical protein